MFITSLSLNLFNSADVITISLGLSTILVSLAIDKAVFILSPVTMTILIPALFISFTPFMASSRVSSFINITPTRVLFLILSVG